MTSPTITCPDPGALRAWLDGEPRPAGLEPHVKSCPTCRATAADLRANADFAAAKIGVLSLPGAPAGQRRARPLAIRLSRWRLALGGLAAALAIAILVATPEGRTATAAFLAQFRSQRLAVVTLDPAFNRNPLSDLERLGTVDQGRRSRPEEVRSVAEAAQRAGFAVKTPDPATLPAGLKPEPRVSVMPASEVRFTLDRDKTRAYLQSVGRPDIAVPEKLDGARLIVRAPAAVLIEYESASGRDLGLAIGQAGELTAGVEGNASLDDIREFLLGLPSLPPSVAAQLRGIKDWRTTLPIPVQPDKMNWQPTTVGGVEGILLADNAGLGSAVMWPKDGKVYGVVGPGRAPEILRVANGLR